MESILSLTATEPAVWPPGLDAGFTLLYFFTSVAAKITTRPGQVGACNGYIVEGEELETLLDTHQDLRLSLESRPEAQ